MPGRKVEVTFVRLVGPIGAGKSTMLKRAITSERDFVASLCALLRLGDEYASAALVVVPEYPERWIDENGANLLNLMGVDRKKYAARFQTTVLLDRVANATNATVDALKSSLATRFIVVTEGGIEVDSGVYAQACRDDGCINDDDWSAYMSLYSDLSANWLGRLAHAAHEEHGVELSTRVGGTLFLDTPIADSVDRVIARGRECELQLPRAYFADRAKRHRDVLAQPDYGAAPVVTIRDTPLDESNPIATQ